MRRNLLAFGALALGWLAGPAPAQELIPIPPMPSHAISNNEPPTVLPSGPAGGGAATQAPAATTVTTAPTIVGSPTYYDNGGYCGDHGGRGWRVYAGADALYLRPHFTSNPGLTINNTIDTFATAGVNQTQSSRETSTTNDFQYDWSVSPRVWIGIENCNGLGVRGRYFRFDQSADPQTAATASSGQITGFPAAINGSINSTVVSTPGFTASNGIFAPGANTSIAGTTLTLTPNPDRVFASSGLELDIIDVEVTQAWRGDRWNIVVAGGARYADIRQSSSFFQPGVFATLTGATGLIQARTFQSNVFFAEQTFRGGGPMIALEAERKLGCSGFSLFGSGRGALVFGRSRTSTQDDSLDTQQAFGNGNLLGTFTFAAGASSERSSYTLLPILEVEVGVQWTRQLGNIELFARGAGVAQVYFDGGNPLTRDGNFGLVGGVATVGFRY